MSKQNQSTANAKQDQSVQTSSGTRLTFAFDEHSLQLKAVISDGDQQQKLDLNSFRSKLDEEGFGDISVEDQTINDVLADMAAGKTGSTLLGERKPLIDLNFEYDSESRQLFAVIQNGSHPQDHSFSGIQEQLNAEGYGSFNVTNNDISNLTLKIQQNKHGRYKIGDKPLYTKVEFRLDKDTNELFADLSPSEEDTRLSKASMSELLKDSGFADFDIPPNALDKLLQQTTKNEHGSFAIGKRQDATIKITLDSEMMNAYISVSPPKGGRDLDESLLKIAMDNAGVYEKCCDQKVLEKVLKEKQAEELLFAYGTEPIAGENAKFEALVEEVVYTKPKENKAGKIDLREIVSFNLIDENTPLMRRIPAKQGKNGINVKGQVITATEAEDFPFADDLEGAAVSEKDPDLLVSTCKGHPVILERGVRVDNSIVVENVDMSTGNISYDGSVLIKGEVKPGMQVRVTGDIIVNGVVSKATLKARNNIKVKCGVLGSNPAKDGADSPPAILKAGGNIEAQYINLVEAQAGHDIIVKEYISHSKVEAKHQILVGQQGGKGKIFGGTCYGKIGVYTKALGADGGTKTYVYAGIPKEEHAKLDHLISTHEKRQTKAKQLTELKSKCEQALKLKPNEKNVQDKLAAIEKVLPALEKEVRKMEVTIDRLNTLFKTAKKAKVSVSSATFQNVHLSINGADFQIRQDGKGGIFEREGTSIRWGNYAPEK